MSSSVTTQGDDIMNVQVQLSAGNFSVSIKDSATVWDLKQKIEEEQGVGPERQSLYFNAYPIDSDNVSVKDLVSLVGTFTLVLPTAAKKRKIVSDTEVFLIFGSRRDFKTLSLRKNKTDTITLSSSKFGVVYKTEGTDMEKKVYNAEVFEIKDKGIISVKTEDREGSLIFTVTLLDEKDPEKPGKVLEGILKSYDESKNTQETSMDKASKASKVLANIGKFIGVIGGLVFAGVELAE
eukprot:GFUD01016412.1.p1 GENE.GFUD01016412.1~~GFUD01016412.1.p1  ORF type:complete len:237 (+),score=49.72 GFUD01016412.1:81-791(+)